MIRKVVIVGGAAGSKIAYDIFQGQGLDCLGFVENYVGEISWGKIEPQLLGGLDENWTLLNRPDVDYFVATGDNAMRANITAEILERTGKHPINAIHPTAFISNFAEMGSGNLICPRAVIHTGAKVGNGTIVNTGAIVEHDNVIEDYAQISSGVALAGYVKVESKAFLGIGASVVPKITIGSSSVVGAGAVVITNVPARTLVTGCPAKVKRRL